MMPISKNGVTSQPKQLMFSSELHEKKQQAYPLPSYHEWKQNQHKNLPKAWKQTDTLDEKSLDVDEDDDDDEETKIELPQNLKEREVFVYAAQKKVVKEGSNEASQRGNLIPVDPSVSFESWPLCSTVSSSSSFTTTMPTPTDVSSNTSFTSLSSSSSSPNISPPSLIVPTSVVVKESGDVYVTDKPPSKLESLVLASAFSPVPMPLKRNDATNVRKSQSDEAINRKAIEPQPLPPPPPKPLILKSPKKSISSSSLFPSDRNIDICKQYEMVKAVRYPNTWLDEMEAIAIIVFLCAVIGLLFYRMFIINII